MLDFLVLGALSIAAGTLAGIITGLLLGSALYGTIAAVSLIAVTGLLTAALWWLP